MPIPNVSCPVAAAALALMAASGAAQVPPTQDAPIATPTATSTPVETPTPATPTAIGTSPPTPVATPTPAATPTPVRRTQPRPTPTAPRATPTPTPTPRTLPTPGVSPTPGATAPPVVTVAPSPTAAPTAVAAPPAEPAAPWRWEPWLFGGAAVVLLAMLWRRYRREAPPQDEAAAAVAPPPPIPTPPPAPERGRGAWLTVDVRPVRAGLNLVTAVVDCEVAVTNAGEGAARDIRAALVLIGAHAGQAADIDAASVAPIARATVPAFTLQAGETHVFRGVASAAIAAVPTMRAGGRDMVVPIVVLNLDHCDDGDVACRTSQAFVIGVERVDSAKLAPFWLDSLRMIEHVAARANGATERRRLG